MQDRIHSTATSACPKCGSVMTRTYGHRTHSPRPVWSFSHHCAACGYALAGDGPADEMPEDVRKLFYREHGRWALRLISTTDRPKAIRGLQQYFSLKSKDALSLMNSRSLLTGTIVEVSQLAQALGEAGAVTEAVRDDET